MLYCKKIILSFLLSCLTLFTICSMAFCSPNDDCIAVAYTGENYQGLSWKIYKSGEYDLWWKIDNGTDDPREKFNLPNDSVCSLRICPGYTVILYKDASLRGDEFILKNNISSLGPRWNREASSLSVFVDKDRRLLRKWWASVDSGKGQFAALKDRPDRDEIADILQRNKKKFLEARNAGEQQWYGDTSDDQRIKAAEFLVKLFGDLGYDVSSWTPESFAQQMNNFYDWRKDLTVWQVACMVLNVDSEFYENIFDGIK